MTTDEKRRILYAALLRYSPEASSLRNRALDRFVLVALLGSSKSIPMTVSQIQDVTVLAPKSLGLRTDVIEETLGRLVDSKRVEQAKNLHEQEYFLTELGLRHTDEASQSASQIFQPVLNRMLQDSAGLFSVRDGETVCRTFITECFARFGHQIASAVAGDVDADCSMSRTHINSAFNTAIESVSLSDEAIESLRSRCNRFIHSPEPADRELRFKLVQSYYVI